MTPKFLIDHAQSSIDRALRHDSALDEHVLQIRGFSTGVMRRFFSNLTRLPDDHTVYLEVGLYGGGTFCAALNNNHTLHAYGIENFSESFGDAEIKEHLFHNLSRYITQAKSCTLVNENVFEMNLSKLDRPVDIYFYDGHHSDEFQYKALPELLDAMAKTFIFIVDDFNWDGVKRETLRSIKELKDCKKIEVHKEWKIFTRKSDDPIWHNGLYVAVLTRP